MAPPLIRGRIVWADIVDQNGVNLKHRPVVLLTAEVELPEAAPFVVVAVTSTIPKPLPNDHVTLPYHRNRHQSRTGLTSPSAAVCSWLTTIPRIIRDEDIGGVVPPAELEQIEQKIFQYARRPLEVDPKNWTVE